jgi:hypothetical protein
MFFRRKPPTRSLRYPRDWPWTLAWAVGLALSVAALLGLAFLNGHGAPKGDNIPEGILQTATKPGVAIVLAFLALTGIALCVRQLLTKWAVWWPGSIEVGAFDAGGNMSDADALRHTMRFRHHLATLRLQAPTPVPGTASGGPFLEVLGRGGVDSRNLLGSILSFLRATKPDYAWKINGVLAVRDKAPRFGVTVQVLRLPNQGNPPERLWGRTWDEALRCAAEYATAAILPRTRRCRTPWATWRRYHMRGELLEAYEQAVGLQNERRYDEALDAYYRALAWDPPNLALRLQIGQLQEKLGLFLDALSTYEGIRALHKEGAQGQRLRNRPSARSERRRAALAARYRRNVLLGGNELAEQWREPPRDASNWTDRERRRRELRDRLRPKLKEEMGRNLKRLIAPGEDDLDTRRASLRQAVPGIRTLQRVGKLTPGELLDEPPATGAEDPVFWELREMFGLTALLDLKRVRHDVGIWRLRRDRRVVLSPDTIELTEQCIKVRVGWIKDRISKVAHPHEWPPNPVQLEADVRDIEHRWGDFHRWHEHYNAACVYALPLLSPSDSDTVDTGERRRDDLAKLAVKRLERAAAFTDSSYIVGRREWLLSEDPDLNGLRDHWRFKSFEAMYFPTAKAPPFRPRGVRRLESSRYIRDLLIATGKRWEETWHLHGRALSTHPDVHTLLEWWSEECSAWHLVRNVAVNYRHWLARLELINKMHVWGDAYDLEPLVVPFSPYEASPLQESTGEVEALEVADLRLDAIRNALPAGNGPDCREGFEEIEKWQATLQHIDAQGRGPNRLLLAMLCDQHAALWQRFHEWVAANGDEKERRAAFKNQLRETRRWCRRAREWWRTPVLTLAIVRRASGAPAAGLGQRMGGRHAQASENGLRVA